MITWNRPRAEIRKENKKQLIKLISSKPKSNHSFLINYLSWCGKYAESYMKWATKWCDLQIETVQLHCGSFSFLFKCGFFAAILKPIISKPQEIENSHISTVTNVASHLSLCYWQQREKKCRKCRLMRFAHNLCDRSSKCLCALPRSTQGY